ncbi:endonuclease domain-containing protein [Melittangium boletus]|uniref:DUF559 domain-containing protein n=1 Tax=Melittangium boletus DSM 14713 TaxID=1294270 RepID=A0A250IDL4_9BACT|nr:DUF559 domain-containing protein [Melittangium boletus]ATB29939.1 hypothetical protein MEBOL_003394 [Melittangium boletus DSM 14713]
MPPSRSSSPTRAHPLERHQRQRERGHPTLSVLAGPPGAALAFWRSWLDTHARPLALVSEGAPSVGVRQWLTALDRIHPLATLAADFLGAAAGMRPGELPTRLEARTEHERDVILQALWPTLPPGDAATACQLLLRSAQVVHKSGGPVDALLAEWPTEPLRALGAMHALVPQSQAPALLLSGAGDARWLADAARFADRAFNTVPSLVMALQALPAEVDAYLGLPGGSRAQTYVREGLLPLEAPSAEQLQRRLESLGLPKAIQTLDGPLARLAEEGVPDEVLVHYGEAARYLEAASHGSENVDRARSSAERFLYELLEAMPATRGLFELNARAGFRFGGREIEVDFLSRRLRVAIEVDGYHHFRDEVAYRRDRRKDLTLQRHGYWVVRILANDVVARLEEIRDTLREVVSLRREGLEGSPSHREDGDAGA